MEVGSKGGGRGGADLRRQYFGADDAGVAGGDDDIDEGGQIELAPAREAPMVTAGLTHIDELGNDAVAELHHGDVAGRTARPARRPAR